jgi:hypothetical protein
MNIAIRPLTTAMLLAITILFSAASCRSTRKISKVIATKEKDTVAIVNTTNADSIRMVDETLSALRSNYINFKTFSAKIKIDYEDSKGKQPDVNAYVRIFKDSLIWINIRSVFLDIDAFRVLIRPDSVFVVNKMDKEVQLRSLDYLQEVTEIPFDFKTLQDLLVGNPVFMDSNIVAFRQNDDQYMLSMAGPFFKHFITLSSSNKAVLHSKLDDVDLARNRTADITYSDFETRNGPLFATRREIVVAEKNRLDIRMNYKQYDFNKELSISFSIPKGYKRR